MRWAAVTFASIMFALMTPQAGFAHDDVVATTPRNGDQLAQAPKEVRIQFAERPQLRSGAVVGPDGRRLVDGPANVDGFELVIPVRPSEALGAYSVEFRVESSDGHLTDGTLGFKVIGQSTPVADPAVPVGDSTTDNEAELSAWPWVLLTGGAGVVIVALLAARFAFRRVRGAS